MSTKTEGLNGEGMQNSVRKQFAAKPGVVQRRTSCAAASSSVNPAGTIRENVVATGALSLADEFGISGRGLGKIRSRFRNSNWG
jgi:hypothetical protein